MSIYDAKEGCLSEKSYNLKLINQNGYEKVVNTTVMLEQIEANWRKKVIQKYTDKVILERIAQKKENEKKMNKKKEIKKKEKKKQEKTIKNIKPQSKEFTNHQNDFSLRQKGGSQSLVVWANPIQLFLVLTFALNQYYYNAF